GVYKVDVFSSVPADRYFSVAYSDDEAQFLLSVQDEADSKVLVALFTTGPGSADDSEFSVSPVGSVLVGQTYTATVAVEDRFGNSVADEPVRFALSGSACPVSFDGVPAKDVMTDADGLAAVELTAAAAGSCALAARLGGADGPTIASPATLTWENAPVVRSAVLSVVDGSALADGFEERLLVVSVVDGSGAGVAGAGVSFSVPAEVSAGSAPGPVVVSVETGADGSASLALTSSSAGSYEVWASVEGVAVVAGSPASVVFDPVPPPAAPVSGEGLSRLEPVAGSALADGAESRAVRAYVTDADANPLANREVLFSIPERVQAGPVPGPAVVKRTTDAAGVAILALTSQTAGSYGVSAEVEGVVIAWGSPAVVVFDPVPPVTLDELLAPNVNPVNATRLVGSVQDEDQDAAAEGVLKVVVTDAVSGLEIARCPVGVDGKFDCALPDLPHDTAVEVRIEDDQHNASPTVLTLVDGQPPVPGGTVPSDGTAITGQGEESGHAVVVRHADGSELCGTQVADDISWACDLEPDAAEGDMVTIEHTDQAGNTTQIGWRIGVPQVAVDRSSIHRGGRQIAVGTNFQPGELVTATMHSDPIDLGSRAADADGKVTLDWVIPDHVDHGGHQVELTGELSGAYSAAFDVVLLGDPEPTPSATGGPEPTPTGTGGPEPTPTGTGGPEPTPTGTGGPEPTATATASGTAGPTDSGKQGTTSTATDGTGGGKLPRTGAGGVQPLVLAGLALVLAGGLMAAAARRRQQQRA
ncbi:MAG: Ig-like domain-containing protein, partial [Bifidobacteriaceae bacterium]|nr:Ig-like domain-containing protein [Bifidobacteriaceae bacterium]